MFFDATTYSLLGINEKISVLQLKELLDKICDRLSSIRKRIQTKVLSGSSYIPNIPYASHFHFSSEYEDYLKTLELNFFVNKYNDMSDKDGILSAVYCINYGLARKQNIPWGKPDGQLYRKYFVQRPFNFNSLIIEFLIESKRIQCTNPKCGKEFSVDQIKFLEFNKFKCNVCSSDVEIKPISETLTKKIESIDKRKLHPTPELRIIQELLKADEPLYAREIAQEIDYSVQLIGWRGKKLDQDYAYVSRSKEREGSAYKYILTKLGTEYFEEIATNIATTKTQNA